MNQAPDPIPDPGKTGPPREWRGPADVTAMNEALLIGALRQHELREASDQANGRLQSEIAERKRIEQALHEAEAKLRADAEKLERAVAERTAQLRASVGELEAFSYTLAHDLRAPVRAIHGFAELALQVSQKEGVSSAAVFMNRVIKAADRMESLITDVLSVSQVIRQPIELRSIDLEALVGALIDERPELAPPSAQITIETPLLRVLGHEATLSQCLTNLLSNAVKFVAPGKVPRVTLRTAEAPASTVRLWVEDEGIGIDPAAQKSIFGMFYRLHDSSRYEGSGIGLTIVRKAVERMGGRVGVESSPGQGSRFWLELPRA